MKIGGDYMRLIDADALKTKAETIQTIDCWHMRTEEQAVLVEHIDNAPTIDAEPVVRCKDCKCWTEWANGTGSCSRFALDWIGTDADDFCSMGERKDDE